MLPASRARVPANTTRDQAARIHRELADSLEFHARHPDKIARRLRELEKEWDVERAIEANASALALVGILLGSTTSKRWLALPALVTGFLLQHALQGWCPPVPILRQLGFRTAYEIEQERQALKAIRGDFKELAASRRQTNRSKSLIGQAGRGRRHAKVAAA